MKKYGLAGLFALFLLFLSSAGQLLIVLRYSANVVFSDQIEYIPLLNHIDWQQLTCDFLGHKRIFPKLLFVALAKLTRWDVRWETFLNWAFLQCTVVFLFLIMKERVAKRHLWLLGISLAYFMVPQYYDDLLWGIQNCMQMNLLAVAAAVYVLSLRPGSWKLDIAAILLLIVATFSFASGLAAWPALLPLFVLNRTDGAPSLRESFFLQRKRIACFAIVALAVFTFYFMDFHSYPRLSAFPQDPWKLFSYFFAFLGGGCLLIQEYFRFPQELYIIAGMLLCVLFAWSFLPGRVDLKKKLPQISLALFILGNALMAALARVYTWNDNALESRYLLLSMLFPVMVFNIHFCGEDKRKPLALPAAILLLVLALEILPGWRAGVALSAQWNSVQIKQAEVLKAYRTAPDDQLYENFVYTQKVREKLETLEKLKYNIFGECR